MSSNSPFRPVPETGVIYVMSRAAELGFTYTNAAWSNLGQGAPEVGEIPDAPARLKNIPIEDSSYYEYAPVVGLSELRQAVADLYNKRYRKNKNSKYTFENVAICSGGRLALTRLISCLGKSNIGHYIPDYTAYEELLSTYGTFMPVPIHLESKLNFQQPSDTLTKTIERFGLSCILLSNPNNPTGKVIIGEELQNYIETASSLGCSVIFDEFYSHYLYAEKITSVSAAEYIEDVNEEEIFILDGLTKNWRYPGFRVSWTLGPKDVIKKIASAGSFLDGGCSHPIQKGVLPLIKEEIANQEAKAIQKHFIEKRDYLYNELTGLGIKIDKKPEAGFYLWGDVSGLPADKNRGMTFFEACLKEKVIVVPGIFFDINPGQRRPERQQRFERYVRFSFGPEMKELQRAVGNIKKVL